MRLIGVDRAGAQANLGNVTRPRIRVYSDEVGALVSLCVDDDHCDPVVAVDFYVTGRVGRWLGDLAWWRSERRRNR